MERISLRVYLSSPGDVQAERAAAVSVLGRLQHDPMIGPALDLQLISWDHPEGPVPLPASRHPQIVVNERLTRPSECDIVIAVLWSRMGTPIPSALGTRVDGSPFESGTEWEIADALTGIDDGPDVLIYHRNTPPMVSLDDPELATKREQFAAVRAYLDRLQHDLNNRGAGFVQTIDSTEGFRRRLENDLRHLITHRIGSAPRRRARQPRWDLARSPYRGLVALTPADEAVFFGRDSEIDALAELVTTHPLTTVVGPSGSGKSSLIGAGLIPRLDAGDPPRGAAAWVAPSFDAERGAWRGPRITPAGLRDQDPTAVLERLLSTATERGHRALIFLDQFEEAFTQLDRDIRQDLIDSVVREADQDRASLVLSIRADYLGHALQHEGLAGHIRTSLLPVGPPGLSAVKDMIEKPAEVAGLDLDADLAESVLVDAGREPGRLPLLAFALAELYRLRDGRSLTMAAYDSIGGLHGAVGRLAERTVEGLPEGVRRELGSVLRQLVAVDEVGGPVRRRARLSAVHDEPHRRRLVDALVTARLLVVRQDDAADEQEPFVELAHEAVFRHWPRLADWIDEEHEHLLAVTRMRRAAAEWQEAGRDSLYLWPQARMDRAVQAIHRLDADVTDTERSFLRPEAERILDELSEFSTTHVRRRDISTRLAQLGDPRPGVGVQPSGVPDLVWIAVRPADGSPFWISKYPVTNSQFAAYQNSRSAGNQRQPARAGSDDPLPSAPTGCSGYEALDFCWWLDRVRRDEIGVVPDEAPDSYTVRLPTEPEWIAAAGTDHGYPWGADWDEARGCGRTSDLGVPLAVGMYPLGESVYGVSDLAGTVWEWCAGEGQRVSFAATDNLWILKGGSRFDEPDQCRVEVRREMRGEVSRDDRGFRVCFGPELSGG